MTSERISDFLVDTRPAAKEDVDDLLEIEQPKWQAQILRGERVRLAAETAPIFVVRIDQEDAQVWSCFQDLLQDDRDTARLADASRAEDGEMPAHQIIDVDVHTDVRVLLQIADMRAISIGPAIDEPQHVLGEHQGGVADIRILRETSLEAQRTVVA